jgi:hypothetical protein
MILIPNMGKLERKSGKSAQCMAHAREVAIPKKSKLTFIDLSIRAQIYTNATMLQNNKAYKEKPLRLNFTAIDQLWERN